MKDLAPEIYRQRLLIEGKYEINVEVDTIKQFFESLLSGLNVNAAGDPMINSSLGQGQPKNQGIEAFLPLIESGVAIYTWQEARFLSMIIYTCKAFEEEKALLIVKDFFQLSHIEHKSF
jgi:S-adenosylmethionine/arginine decarboxylase-like enzyme